MDLPPGPRSSGCWTCRIRRKKCDESFPVCEGCTVLHITCHYDQARPEWMDGGVKQEEMAERIKREVKENASRRRGERTARVLTGGTYAAEVQPQRPSSENATADFDPLRAIPSLHTNSIELSDDQNVSIPLRPGPDCARSQKHSDNNLAFGHSDTVLLMFYLEHLLPFLFPFYKPPALQGGRAWVLEMMIRSPVIRKATLCQSSYFFNLVRESGDEAWKRVHEQTKEAFDMLGQALQVLNGSDISEHLHGAVRVMASILHVQRFEVAVSSFGNCQSHLNAALALFIQIMDSTGVVKQSGYRCTFNAIMSRLGPSSSLLPTKCALVPSAEQAAFLFSSSLLILDDIIASTVLQEQPRLYEYHQSLLGDSDGTNPAIDLQDTIGCQNLVMVQVGEIAALDAWKQQCKRAGTLDNMELVKRATCIKNILEAHLARLESEPVSPRQSSTLLDVLANSNQQSHPAGSQSLLVTRVWAHAAFLYLFVVVSGWQPANLEVRYHVDHIIKLVTCEISPPALLRTMVWPFCVAGCLAEPLHEARFREMVDALQPPSVFGTVRKALGIMCNAWCNRDAEDIASRDLAAVFRTQGGLMLLV